MKFRLSKQRAFFRALINTAHTIFKFRLSEQRAFFRAHINTAQNLLNTAPRGSKQGVFRARTHTEKNAVENEILVM